MSTHTTLRRITVPQIRALKAQGKGAGRIVSLTAYTSLMAKLMDDHVDLIVDHCFAAAGAPAQKNL